MRVLHIVPAIFDTRFGVLGGAERYAFELARHMAEHIPTTLLSFGTKDSVETVGSLRVRLIGKPWHVRGQRNNPISLSLISELRKADVVHCHQQHVLASSLAALICRISARRVFVSDLGGGGWDLSSYVSTDRWFHGHLHISEYSRRVFGHEGKPWAHVVLGGVDTSKFVPNGGPKPVGPALFVGRLLPHKGIDNVVKGLPPEMSLIIIGQPMDPRYIQDLRAMAPERRVSFRHDCTDADLVESYHQALCVVLPSVYQTMYGHRTNVPELLGQTLLEGMACGLPAICTNVASMPEVVEDGVTGFVVPPNDPQALGEKLRWLRDNPAHAKRMGIAARERVIAKFTWPAVVQRCVNIYQN
jgi:glycosyltransferase involved in cell wall biosynthesis